MGSMSCLVQVPAQRKRQQGECLARAPPLLWEAPCLPTPLASTRAWEMASHVTTAPGGSSHVRASDVGVCTPEWGSVFQIPSGTSRLCDLGQVRQPLKPLFPVPTLGITVLVPEGCSEDKME